MGEREGGEEQSFPATFVLPEESAPKGGGGGNFGEKSPGNVRSVFARLGPAVSPCASSPRFSSLACAASVASPCAR